ncbi:MAG: response regulator [Sphingomonas sp.]|uniref:response regulator n=1 Tax=Sphingomonas sp. TaxID=28214 RepID=UPI001AC934D7|nr:response regulator [Sphingomonas sp.]MBN8808253.1 response regulator [Sphingomonas sp.]
MTDETTPFALVVDDDPFIRMDACDIVENAGFRCLDAADVVEAIGQLEKRWESIALLFTDVQLGDGRDGLCLAREVSRRWPEIGILVASGNVRPGEGDLPEGAEFIAKPFNAEVVHSRLAEILPDGQKPEPLKRRSVG